VSSALAGRVSVVIPTWNCERYIAQTLRSVLAQSHPPHEVVVVDDGSTDRTAEIVASFGAAVTLVRQANQGVCVARNQGFARSTGEFLCFLDHDDHWFPNKLAQQLRVFASHPEAGVVFTRFALWQPVDGSFPAPETLAPREDAPPGEEPEFCGWIYHQFLLDCWALTSTAMIRREALERWGAFDPSLPYSEDWELWLRLSRQVPFVKLDCVSTLYRQHPEQGNRKVRPLDYRTMLLEQAVARWGLASRDGRALDPTQYHATLSRYHLQFALHHLQDGSRALALQSLWKAWRHRPTQLKLPALAGAALLGWRPQAPQR
jgi:glycosyltransferase involved in cell wall biosynthesis